MLKSFSYSRMSAIVTVVPRTERNELTSTLSHGVILYLSFRAFRSGSACFNLRLRE